MHSTGLFKQLLVAFSFLAVAQASMADVQRLARQDLVRRQDSSASGGVSPTGRTTPSASPTPTIPSSTSARPTNTPTTTPPSSSSSAPSPTDGPGQTTTSTTSTSETPIVDTITTVITTTNSEGKPTSITTQAVITTTPGFSGDGGSTQGGMPVATRNIVIGVVVGVGGAIILAALAFVAWRIWGRKKQAEENDDMASYNPGYGPSPDKSEVASSNGTSRTPFQSTLESYHAPTQVNASSNF